jgi:hypothetical protein
MRRYTHVPAWSSIYILIFGAITLYSQNNLNIDLHLILTIGEEDADELYQWAGVCADEIGNIYLTDMMDNTLKKFNSVGKPVSFKTPVIHEGSKSTSVRLISYNDNLLYVTAQNKPGFFCYDTNLVYIKSIKYSKPVGDFQVQSRNLIYVTPFSMTGMMKIDAIDSTGRALRSFNMANHGKGGMHDLFSFTRDSAGDWYVCYRFKDRIARLTPNSDVIWEKKLYPGRKGSSEKILFFDVPKTVFYLDASFDNHDHLFILLGHMANNPNRDILVLDRSGKQISRITLDDTSHLLYIDKDDHLYVRAKKGTSLRKYKIIYRHSRDAAN